MAVFKHIIILSGVLTDLYFDCMIDEVYTVYVVWG